MSADADTTSRLPDGWVEAPIARFADVNPSSFSQPPTDDQEVSFVPMAAVEVETGVMNASDRRLYGDLRRKSYRRFQEGDVVVAKITPSMENGKAALAKNLVGGIALGSTEFHVLRSRGEIDPRYLLHFVLQKGFRADAARSMTGTAGQLRVPAEYLRQVPIPVPPFDEQRRIVEAIETHLSHLDAGVESLQRAKRNIERMRAAILKAAVEGRLVPQDPDDEPAERLLDQIAAEKGAKPTKVSSPFVIPESWLCVPFSDVTINHDGKRVPVKAADRAERQGKYPYYGAQGVIDTIDDYLFDGDYLLIAEDGANLLSRNKPLAFLADGRFWVNNHAHIVVPVAGMRREYLALVLNATDISRSVTGTAQPKLTQKNLNKLPMPIPPLSEQERIVIEVELQMSVLDALAHAMDSDLIRSNRLRQSVLASAFSGRLLDGHQSHQPDDDRVDVVAPEGVTA